MRSLAKIFLILGVFAIVGTFGVSAQEFSQHSGRGLSEVKFLPPEGGLTVFLSIDGHAVGALPLVVYVKNGPHQFTFMADGESPKTITFPVNGDVVVPSMFKANGYELIINTNAPNAYITVDGHQWSSNRGRVSPGNHTLTVSANGYQTLVLPFQQPASSNAINLTLLAQSGLVNVQTDQLLSGNRPHQIFIDGVSVMGDQQTLSPGRHQIRIVSGGFSTETSITVYAGQTMTLTPVISWNIQ